MTAALIAAALLQDPTVSTAIGITTTEGDGALVIVPSTEGIRKYRLCGRTLLASSWSSLLADLEPPQSLPALWRLVEHLPVDSAGDGRVLRDFVQGPLLRIPHVDAADTDEDGRIHFDLRVPLELAAFRGHFPAAPIVPGVEQVGWVMTLARQHLPVGRFLGATGIKFRRVIQPADALRLTISPRDAGRVLQYSFRRAGVECSVGRILLDAVDV